MILHSAVKVATMISVKVKEIRNWLTKSLLIGPESSNFSRTRDKKPLHLRASDQQMFILGMMGGKSAHFLHDQGHRRYRSIRMRSLTMGH